MKWSLLRVFNRAFRGISVGTILHSNMKFSIHSSSWISVQNDSLVRKRIVWNKQSYLISCARNNAIRRASRQDFKEQSIVCSKGELGELFPKGKLIFILPENSGGEWLGYFFNNDYCFCAYNNEHICCETKIEQRSQTLIEHLGLKLHDVDLLIGIESLQNRT